MKLLNCLRHAEIFSGDVFNYESKKWILYSWIMFQFRVINQHWFIRISCSNGWIFIEHAGIIFVTHMCECINYTISKYHGKIPVSKSAKQKKYILSNCQILKMIDTVGHQHCFAAANETTGIVYDSLHCPNQSCGLDDGSPAAAGLLITPSENLLTHLSIGCPQFKRSKTFLQNEVNWEDKTDEILVITRGV